MIRSMVMSAGASSRAAVSRAWLNESRRRLPAKPTSRRLSRLTIHHQHQELRTRHARLDMVGDRQRVGKVERTPDVAFQPKNGDLAGPAMRVFGQSVLRESLVEVADLSGSATFIGILARRQ